LPAPEVSLVIPTRGKLDLLKQCLSTVGRTCGHRAVELIIVEHDTTEVGDWIRSDQAKNRNEWLYIHAPEPQSYSSLNNLGVAKANAKYVWLLNNDVLVEPGCLDKMIQVLDEKPEVGIVGAKLLFPERTIQHLGVIFNAYGVPRHLGWSKPDGPEYEPSQRSGYFDSVTFACALIRKDLWDKLGGLDTDYYFNYEDVDFCLRAREAGFRCYVTHEATAIHLEGQSLDMRKTAKHSVMANLAVLRDKWIFNGRLEKVLGIPIQREFGPLHSERRNLAFFPAGKDAGISWWRIELPAAKLAAKKLANIHIFHAQTPQEELTQLMSRADLAVWQGFFNESVKRMAALGPARGFPLIYEYDDHPVYLSPYAQAYRSLGTVEVQIRMKDGEEIWLWRDGEHGFDLELNRQNRQRQLEIMSLSDAMTTTTESLASYFRTLNRSVYTLPNCIDFDYYKAPADLYIRKPGPIRIGYHGGDNHWHDVSTIGPALTKYVNTHDVRFVNLGHFYKGPFKGIDMNKVEELGWVHVAAFPWRLAAAGLDIGLVPLAPHHLPETRFNQFKCVVGDTRVVTQRGVKRIADVSLNPDGKVWQELAFKPIADIVRYAEAPTIRVRTRRGYEIEATPQHRIRSQGRFVEMQSLTRGDHVDLSFFEFAEVPQYTVTGPLLLTKKLDTITLGDLDEALLPKITIGTDWARFLGLMLGDGCFNSRLCVGVSCDAQDRGVIDWLMRFGRSVGLRPVEQRHPIRRCTNVSFRSRNLVWLLTERLGMAEGLGRYKKLRVPEAIWRSPKPVVAAFLSGLFEADGHVSYKSSCIRLSSKSEILMREVQILLLGFGILSDVCSSFNRVYRKTYWYLGLSREAADGFGTSIGFISSRKRDEMIRLIAKAHSNRFRPNKLSDEIVHLQPGIAAVHDLNVPDGSCYFANGFVSHNSDIKWLEYSALRWPSLIQAGTDPYSNCVDGENALTYATEEEFTEKLDALVKDVELRKRLGDRAHDWVREHRNLDKEIHRWLDAYEQVIRDTPIPEAEEARGPRAVAEGS